MLHDKQSATLRLRENRMNNQNENVQPSSSGGGTFQIRVKGQLNNNWSDWLEGLDVKLLNNGEMILSGVIVDQAALIGILNKLSRLNLTLISLNEVSKK
jgi:hypothetical protein